MEFKHLSRQYEKFKSQIDSAVSSVLQKGIFIGGDSVSELERQLQRYVGVRHAITCANGSDALEIALKVLNFGVGDAVFVPSFTYIASASCIKSVGAIPVFVDVTLDTFNVSTESLEKAIDKIINETSLIPKAIIAVDLFGIPANYAKIKEIAIKYRLRVIEDGAQGFGGDIGEQMACSFGDISTTSFFPVKPLGCYGDGGAIFTDNDEYALLIKSIKAHGAIPTDKYNSVQIGRNSRLDTLQAAILSVKLNIFNDELMQIQKIAAEYSKLLQCEVITPVVPKGYYSAWAQYTVRFKDENTRDVIKMHLQKKGISTMLYYRKPLHLQQAFDGTIHCDLNDTDILSKTVHSLPFSPYMTIEEVRTVCDAIREIK